MTNQEDKQGKDSSKPEDAKSLKKVLIVVALIGAALWVPLFGGGEGEEDLIQGATVKRGDVEITVVERGNLASKNAASIKSEIEGRCTILSMVTEGTYVEAGDIVCELDTTDEINRIVEQEIEVQSAEAEFTKARENLEIQKLNNESEIAKAETAKLIAQIDLTKYSEGEWPQQQQKAVEDIKLAETELKQTEEQLDWSRQLFEKGFLTRTELEGDELSFDRSKIKLEQTKRAKDLLEEYEHPKQTVQLQEDLNEANRELARVKKEANAEIVDYEVALKTREVQLELERQQHEKLKDQIEKGVLRAPSAGMVVYGRHEGDRWGRGEPVQLGAEVRERQEIISIPSPGAMVAEMTLHESALSQVTKGLPCRISVDAVPGLEFNGSISFVSPLPDKNAWFANPNLRLFKTEVALDEPAEGDEEAWASLRELRPGMSCSVEVFVERVSNALYVPLQCVFHKGGKNVSFVRTGSGYEEREVVSGPHNTQIVVVATGLKQGEVVLMSAPTGALEVDGEDPSLESPAPRFDAVDSGSEAPSKRPASEGGGGPPDNAEGAVHARTAPEAGVSQGAGRPGGSGRPDGAGHSPGRGGGGRPQGAGSGAGRPTGSGG